MSLLRKILERLVDIADNDRAPFDLRVSLGLVPGWSIMSAMGERESMGTTVSGEDIWRGNDLTPAPTSHTTIPTPASAGEQMEVVSESASDSSIGTGVQSVTIDYLTATGAEPRSVIVTLAGTTPVQLPASIRFVQDMHSYTTGVNGVAAGHIKVRQTSTPGRVYNMIAQGGNKSLVPLRMVPAGRLLLLRSWHAEEAQSKRCAFRIRSTSIHGDRRPGVFLFKGVGYLKQTTSGDIPLQVAIPELAIVKVSGWPVVSGAEGSTGWWGFLVDLSQAT